MVIDRTGLAGFLRRRRETLQPEDVGLPRGQRRRTSGLRREEVAALCHMSSDYYSRLERERGPQPSEQMIASIAQGLHLSLDERDHLFRLAGHNPPTRGAASEHISPGLQRILDRLYDTPAEIVTELASELSHDSWNRADCCNKLMECPRGSVDPDRQLTTTARAGQAFVRARWSGRSVSRSMRSTVSSAVGDGPPVTKSMPRSSQMPVSPARVAAFTSLFSMSPTLTAWAGPVRIRRQAAA
ncbi:helix-turn-helix domain-containing protein [Streptomyces sp. NPDC056390]|uniref:helix-turn-helix domain-containing protein n=1 Tax=Streptomyces sp. NPDC056390 TaxID=3345806 RepID=UPI0035DCCC04